MNVIAQIAIVLGVMTSGFGLLAIGWKILRKVNQLYDAFTEFPPHRHINGKILYPKEFAPGKVEVAAE